MMAIVSPSEDRVFDAINVAITQLVPVNLESAVELMSMFVSKQIRCLISSSHRETLWMTLWRRLIDEFPAGSGSKLVTALRDRTPYVLGWLCWTLDRIRTNQFDEIPFEGWEKFSPVILEAADIDPSVILPQVLSFILDESRPVNGDGRRVDRLEFNRERATRLFGDTHKLLELFCAIEPPEFAQFDATQYVKDGFEAVRRAARESSSEGNTQVEPAGTDAENVENMEP